MKNGLYLTDCFFSWFPFCVVRFLADIFSYKSRFIFSLFIGICLSDFVFLFCNRFFDFAADLFFCVKVNKIPLHPNGWQRYKLNRGGR